MPDDWEVENGFDPLNAGDATTDADVDGLSNLEEYRVGSNPLEPDSDGDLLPDGWEVQQGLSPADFADAMADPDGDGVPTLWEHARGTNPRDASSRPPTNRVVSAQGGGDHTSLQAAFNAASDWDIIEVREGTYSRFTAQPSASPAPTGSQSSQPSPSPAPPSFKRVAWIASPSQSFLPVEIVARGPLQLSYTVAFNGFRLRGATYGDNVAKINRGTAGFSNCLFSGSSGAASSAVLEGSPGTTLVLIHCTMVGNAGGFSPDASGANAISAAGRLAIVNSILWNPDNGDLPEVQLPGHPVVPSGNVTITDSIIRDGGHLGAITDPPALTPNGLLLGSSPARAAAQPGWLNRDFEADPRGSTPDIGWDEFHDSDGDLLPDWLERLGVTEANGDEDGDGLTNIEEIQFGSDLWQADGDGDNLNDFEERLHRTNPYRWDTDGDGLSDGWEVLHGLNPAEYNDPSSDTDGDGIPLSVEIAYGLSLTSNDSQGDLDGDGLTNLEEVLFGSDLGTADWDGDGLNDFQERFHNTNPYWWDTDGDGLGDSWEVLNGLNPAVYDAPDSDPDNDGIPLFLEIAHGLNPSGDDSQGDLDGDGLTNLEEVLFGSDLGIADWDGDGLNDFQERFHNTDPYWWDTDGDGLTDGWEVLHNLNPAQYDDPSSDSDGDGIPLILEFRYSLNPQVDDSQGDLDGDGLTNIEEVIFGSDLRAADSDRDGLNDFQERLYGTNPNSWDTDGDSLPDGFEVAAGNLNPLQPDDPNADSDNDGLSNRIEAIYGLDPSADDSQGDLDGDGLTNLEESVFGSSPIDADIDADGLNDFQERFYGTDPWHSDSEGENTEQGIIPGDGLPDGWEVQWGFDPTQWTDPNADDDNDGLGLLQEYRNGTNPHLADTDGDGTNDGTEVANRTSPRDPAWGGAPPAAPSNVTSTPNTDGTTTITWTDNADNETEIIVRTKQGDGSWEVAAELPPNTTSVTVP
jgi:hypothetical protein